MSPVPRTARRLGLASVVLLASFYLTTQKPEKRFDPLREQLESPIAADRAWAVFRLAHSAGGSPEALRRLLPMLSDQDPLVRSRVAEGLSHFRAQAELVVIRLDPAVHDQSPTVREAAVLAVGRLAPAGNACGLLRYALRDPESKIRDQAASSLAACR